jgi:hypothetical protein
MQKRKSPIAVVVILLVALAVFGIVNLSNASGRSLLSQLFPDKQDEAPQITEQQKEAATVGLAAAVSGSDRPVKENRAPDTPTENLNATLSSRPSIIIAAPTIHEPILNESVTSAQWFLETSHHEVKKKEEDAERAKSAGSDEN